MQPKRYLLLLISLLLLLSLAQPATASVLPDVIDHWAENKVRHLVELGAIEGYPDGTFQPEDTITRAEFSAVICRALGLDELDEMEWGTFQDVEGHWGEEWIESLVSEGIIDSNIYGTSYKPDEPITRQEISMMTVRIFEPDSNGSGEEDIPFKDVDKVGTEFYEYVAQAYHREIITGYPDNTFKPEGSATRAEAAVMAVRSLEIFELKEKEEEKEPEPEPEDEEESEEQEDVSDLDPLLPDDSQDLLLSSASRSALVMKNSVNIRSAPGVDSSIIGRVTYGSWLEITDDRDGWYQVRLDDGQIGWIAGWLVVTRYESSESEGNPATNNNFLSLIASWQGEKDSPNPDEEKGSDEEKGPVITDMQVMEMEKGVKLKITADSPLELPQVLRLNSPSRLAFDFPGLLADSDNFSPVEVGHNPVNKLRASQFEEEMVRVVADLQEDMVHSVIQRNDDKTIEIVFLPVLPLDKTVVIDPGHGTLRSWGGSDPGAIGPTGLTEREVVINVSRKLGEILINEGYSVVFIREKLTGLDNLERADVANMCGGIFVSIHANGHPNNDIMGTETFYPGTRGGASQEYLNTSKDLATAIQEELVPSLQRPDRGVKQANFAVLRDNQVPAALTEVAFITNSEEEKLLATIDFQMKAAQAIAKGIDYYFGRVGE